jgi:hypothetical protein
MNEGAQKTLQAFEAFLGSLDLASYRKKYQRIKTVEQNLPRNLSPLPDLYKHYWKPTEGNPAFPSFEDFFNRWWDEHLEPLNAFRQRYFWGCSCEFVRLGFEARLYRTAISIWTQFHFCYRWLASCSLPLEANQERDAKGIDALVHANKHRVGIQIKKETYRSEAREENRFLKNKKQRDIALLEVPYTLQIPEKLRIKAERARKKGEDADIYLLWAKVAHHLKHLPNGFVIFQESYVKNVENFLQTHATSLSGVIPWKRVAEEALTSP